MGRRLRTMVSMTDELLSPKWTYLPQFQLENARVKEKQKEHYGSHHGVLILPSIPDQDNVWIKSDSGGTSGRVVSSASTPRSYIVETPTGHIRRNRCDIKVMSPTPEINRPVTLEPSRIMTRSQTGTVIKPPTRYQQS